MNQFYTVIGISSKGDILDQVSRKEGIKTIGVMMTRKITPFKDLISTYQLYKILKRKNRLLFIHILLKQVQLVC